MVDKIFYLNGENLFGTAFRSALKSAGYQLSVKVHITNIHTEQRIRVIASGIYDNVLAFHNEVRSNNLRVLKDESPKYAASELQDYTGIEIDWNAYNIEFISEQLSNSIIFYNNFLEHINERLARIEKKVSSSSLQESEYAGYDVKKGAKSVFNRMKNAI